MSSLALRDRLAQLAPITSENNVELVTSAYTIAPLDQSEISANRHSLLEDDYFTKFESLKQNVNEIENHVRHISHIHAELLVKAVAPETQRRELEGIMEKVSSISRHVQANIQALGKRLERDEAVENRNDADYRMHKVQCNSIIKRFNTIMDQYQQEQTTYRSRCKERIKRQLKIVGKDINDEEIDEMLNVHKPNIFSDEFGSQKQQSKQALDEIEQRHNDILQLEENMRELQEMFDELARLIDEQGEVIDRIDLQVEIAKEHVYIAAKETHQAIVYTRKSKKKLYIIVCIIISVVIAIVVGVIVVIAIAAGVAGALR
ncbi:syntaxin [Oopsacas minuta]|uniref:Syntaxin n=1 Tax=Oopsacas minuta TaxID=111878 RepID=A0AAV7K9C0_9METZ|nr:syntaxin [Oopsacas minuta]